VPPHPLIYIEIIMKPILLAKNLSKSFKTPIPTLILKKISLEVFPGETVAITGKSGEGKTTLLHLLGTLESPSAGTLEISGIPAEPSTWSLLRNQKIGFVFQTYNLLEDYTAFDNVLMPAKIGGHATNPGSPAHTRALQLLSEVGLSERIYFPSKLLSGGEKQRVAIARAFENDPDLILADEPSGNLDHAHSRLIYDLLLKAATIRGKALIVVTHDPELAALCGRHYALTNGVLT
jgi:lipoprotein-releasing system ATP-binding protein